MSHPRHQLDPVFQNAARFSVMAILASADRVEFRFARDAVELSDSSLSQHVTALEHAGYVEVVKGQVARRPRTWLAATHAGREAFDRHVDVLNRIARSPLAVETQMGPPGSTSISRPSRS